MPSPSAHSGIVDDAPTDDCLTAYDRQHLVTYLRLLDAEADGADWEEAARLVLGIDAQEDHHRAHRAWRSHLARAHWMTQNGYRDLLREGDH